MKFYEEWYYYEHKSKQKLMMGNNCTFVDISEITLNVLSCNISDEGACLSLSNDMTGVLNRLDVSCSINDIFAFLREA